MVKIRSFALGGLDEVGKNLFVVEVDQDLFIFDCGLKILKEVDFGINSLVADFEYLVTNKHRIQGLFVTKIDIVAAYGIPFLLKKIPTLKVFTSKTSHQLLIRNQAIFTPQLEKNLYQIDDQPLQFGKNFIHAFATATNLPGSCGFSLETRDGYVVYTGAFILANSAIEAMFNTQINKIILNQQKPVLLLISNVNQININGFITPKHQVDKWLNKVLFDFKKTLFICCEDNEWYKLFTIISRLRQLTTTNFEIAFFDQTFAQKFSEVVFQLTKDFYWKQFARKNISALNKHKQKIIFLTGSQKWLFSRVLSLLNSKDQNLALTNDDHLWIVGESALVGELVITKTLNELYKTDAKITFTGKSKIFAMEAACEDIKLLINLLKPKYFFPTNARHQNLENTKKLIAVTHLQKDDIFVMENGEIITIHHQKHLTNYQAIILENVFVDNFLNTNINQTVINERKILSENGVLFVSFCYGKREQEYFLNSEVKNTHFGITKKSEQVHQLNDAINSCVLNLFNNRNGAMKNDLKQSLRKTLMLIVKKITAKTPLIFITANFG